MIAEATLQRLPPLAGMRIEQQRRAIRVGAAVLPDETIESMLREETDSSARNAALAMMKLRGARGRRLALRLLDDEDPDVVLQAILALDSVQQDADLPAMIRAAGDPNTNIAQAAIVALGHSRNPAAHSAILRFTGGDPWLQAAAIEALGSLRDLRAVPVLRELADDSVVGPLVVQAIAGIGGQDALDALSAMWMSAPRESIESHDLLEAIVSVAEGADRLLFAAPLCREEFARRIGESDRREHDLLVRARIALGRHEVTAFTVEQFLRSRGASPDDLPLPSTLRHHPELTPTLLTGAPRWAVALAAQYADRISPDVLQRLLMMVLDGTLPENDIPLLAASLQSRDALPRGAAAALVAALEKGVPAARALFRGLVSQFAHELSLVLAPLAGIPMAEHVLIAAALPRASWTVVNEIERLPAEERESILLDLVAWPETIAALPWERWVEETPSLLRVAARLSRYAPLPRLMPRFRESLAHQPAQEIIDAIVHAGDPAGEALLVEQALASPREDQLEALGRCRGEASLDALRTFARNRHRAQWPTIIRALARRATSADLPLFLGATTDADWLVRHACVRALSRCLPSQEAIDALIVLSSDPARLVSEGAITVIEATNALR